MGDVQYPSTERVERDGVLIYAEGDELLNDPDEMKRQHIKADPEKEPKIATKRIERDGVLVAAEGDIIPEGEKAENAGDDKADGPGLNKARTPTSKK